MRAAAAPLAAALLAAAPGLALACPACARDTAPWAPLLVAAMMAVPYAVALVVVRAARAGSRRPGGER